MVFCSSCGKPTPETARFCRHCGAPQGGTAPSPVPPPAPAAAPERKRPTGVTAAAVMLILAGVGALFSLAIDAAIGSLYGWTPWHAYLFAIALYYTPADFAMAVGLLMGRKWGWKLSVASLCALVFLSIPPFFSGSPITASISGFQAVFALPFWLYLATSGRVRAHFGTERAWLHPLLSAGYKPPAGGAP